MEFFVIGTIQNGNTSPSGIGIERMVKVYKDLGKNEAFKDLESVSPYQLVYLEQGQFSSQEGLAFIGKNKKECFALVSPNTLFSIIHDNKTYFAKIHYNRLAIADSITLLENICYTPDLSGATPVERKAYEWLESGKTGSSSLAICKKLLPNLKHDRLSYSDRHEPAYPRDGADFKRCMFLFDSVPEIRQDLDKMRPLSSKWDKLVEKWNDIENLIRTDESTQSYELIKSCIEDKKPKP